MPLTADNATYAHICIERLYREHQRAIRAYLRRLISDDATAEDLCQETFLKALRSWEAHNPEASATSWLYRIATNTAYDYLRRRRQIRFTVLADAEPLPPDHQQAMEGRFAIQEPLLRALAQLPTMYRLPLVLHTYAGYSLQEIAETLGCTSNAIKLRLFRARARFRQIYQG
jgi:RNA polymerase sigma-70 factor (ECF subfamily)